MRIETHTPFVGLFGLVHLSNFIYYALGILWHKHFETVNTYLKNNTLLTAACIITFVGNMYTYELPDKIQYVGPSSTLYFLLIKLATLITAVATFQKYRFLSDSNFCGRFLNLAGTWSIEIYFLHYFFLPRNLKHVGQWFDLFPNQIIEILLILIIAVATIYFSVIAARIIAVSPNLAQFFFGRKEKA